MTATTHFCFGKSHITSMQRAAILRHLAFISLLCSVSAIAQPHAVRCKGIGFLWQHVYNPQRLELKTRCTSVTGVIASKKGEPDGDVHIKLKLDSQFGNLLNDGNRQHQDGRLVVEPICDHTVTQQDAKAACADFHSRIPYFKNGTHVTVVGSYVLDHEHGWMEIHPVIRITEIQ